jgi:putative PEP-CTERM system TPR-repeat lipoprotein
MMINLFSFDARSALRTGAVAFLMLLAACRGDGPEQFVDSARSYIGKGDYPAAAIQLKNALQRKPDDGVARLLLGQVLLETRDLAGAEKELRRALELNQPADAAVPSLARALLEQGKAAQVVSEFGATQLNEAGAQASFKATLGSAQLMQGDIDAAGAAYRAALAARPGHAQAEVGMARIAARAGRIDEALTATESVIQREPSLIEARLLKADLLLAKRDVASAAEALRAAVEAAPNDVSARVALLAILIDQARYGDAAGALDDARKVARGDLRLVYYDALLGLRRGDLARARSSVQHVLKSNPDHVPSLVLSGAVEMQSGQLAAAEAALRKALAKLPEHAGARRLLVATLLRGRDPLRAQEALQPMLDVGLPQDPQWQMLAGETLLASGDYKQAATHFEAASAASKQAVAARTRLGQIAFATGNEEAGLREWEEAAALDPAQYQADLALIAGHLKRKETAKALEVARGLAKKQPNNPLSYQMIGAVELMRGQAAAARTQFERARELDPTYLPAAQSLAVLDLAEKKPQDARKRFEAMIEKQPRNERLYFALAELQTRTGAQPQEVAKTLKRAIDANPQAVDARVALVQLHLRARDAAAALNAAQEAAAALRDEPRVVEVLGIAQEGAEQPNQAIETFNRLAAIQPQSPQPLMRLAALYLRRNDLNRAIEATKRARALAPQRPAIGAELAALYIRAGQYEAAVNEAAVVQAAVPKLGVGQAIEGDAFAAQKKWGDAQRAYREALELQPKSSVLAAKLHGALLAGGLAAEADKLRRKWLAENPKDAVFRMHLANEELAAKRLKSAAAYYQAVIALEPNNPIALNNLAWIGGQQGDPKALDYAQRAAKVAPNNASVLDTLGMLLVERGDKLNGLDTLKRAMSLAPSRPELKLNYAKALIKVGRNDEARTELAGLLEHKGDFPGKEEVPALLKSL